MIDTAEKRRSALDFASPVRGTGMPIPSGVRNTAWRGHVLNLYTGIAPIVIPFIFWRARTTTGSFWRKSTEIRD